MIPLTVGFLNKNFTIKEQPSLTYRMDFDSKSIRGKAEDREAVRQAIFKVLNTERYQYIMYSWNYGIETLDLYGEPVTFVCPELERRIREALLVDSRIISVTDFEHDLSVKHTVYTTFTVHTIHGDVRGEREVNL